MHSVVGSNLIKIPLSILAEIEMIIRTSISVLEV